MRRFAIIGNRAMAQGKLPLNDMAGAAGRMDVLVRALMSALMTSHGMRRDSEIILHLHGGPGPARRIKFVGSELKGVHAEERAVAGQIGKVIQLPTPARGQWIERSSGIYDGGGDIDNTISEWKDSAIIRLDAGAPRLWSVDSIIPQQSNPHSKSVGEWGETEVSGIDIAFILSDDKPLTESEILMENTIPRSLGEEWIQGHLAIAICHFLLDEGVSLNL
jgi:tRNA pseudouridine-54 N-methylase